MAFCNSCGSDLAPGAKFCTKCGAVVSGAPTPPAPVAPIASSPAVAPGPAAPTTGGSAAKIILIVVGVVVIFGILGIATLGIIGVHIARRTHFTQDGNRVKVETPFGSVDTSKDPQQMAKDLGVDIYPGAQAQTDGSAIATFGGVRTAAASFISSDPLDKVCDFYRAKFPKAASSTSSQNQCSIVSGDQANIVTITIEPSGGSTKIQISSVSKSSTNSN
jgi:hypothetical protein